jgi:hypothetical protein
VPLEVASAPLPPKQPKRRRVPINIVDWDEMPLTNTTIFHAAADDLMKPVSTRSLHNSQPLPSTSINAMKPATFQEAKQARVSKAGGGIFRSSGSHTVFNTALSDASKPSPKAFTAPTEHLSSASITSLSAPIEVEGDPTLPWTLFIFSRNWNALSSPADRWQLLSVRGTLPLPPSSTLTILAAHPAVCAAGTF